MRNLRRRLRLGHIFETRPAVGQGADRVVALSHRNLPEWQACNHHMLERKVESLVDKSAYRQDLDFVVGDNARQQLLSFIERIERLQEEKDELASDIREVFAEAKGNGFDPKIMRMALRLRKMDPADRAEQEAVLDTYMHALDDREPSTKPEEASDSEEEELEDEE